MATQLIVLGVDAASPVLIRRWADEGKLPALRALMDGGVSGTVAGVEGFYVGSTWPSFYTGLNPAGHGIYRIEQFRSGTYEFFRPFDIPDGIGGTPFWRLASDAGRRVAVLDVPLSRVEPRLNGVQSVEWGGHDAVFGFRTSPPEWADEIRATVGPYPLPEDCNGDRRTAADFEGFVAGLERATSMRAQLTLDVLRREPWDLVVQVFTEAHCAGHQCWHLHDPNHPAHDPGIRAELGDPLERVYRAVDAGIARIVEQAGDARVLVFSAHGMSHFRGAHFLLPRILHRLGATARRAAPAARRGPLAAAAAAAASTVGRLLPERARAAARALSGRPGGDRPRAGQRSGGAPSGRRPVGPLDAIDLERSRCFPVANGFPVAGIRLNLAGREPHGVLRPGAEAKAFCARLADDLLAIRDERVGGPLVRRVVRTEALYRGPRRDALPDLLVEWNDVPTGTVAHGSGERATVRASSAAVGTLEGTNRWPRTGEHVPHGFFAFGGAGVAPGRRDLGISSLDLHPTICRLLGLPDPPVDGAVVPELAG
jgi:predicted AlkP superfamily phosphohydrolase/phosphomutase